MKKLFILALSFLGFVPLQAQSAYQVVRQVYKVGATPRVIRHLRAPVANLSLANEVAHLGKTQDIDFYADEQIFNTKRGTVVVPQINIVTQFRVPYLKNPANLWGSYQYLRILTSWAKEPNAVNADFESTWKKINITNGYNGVHHIVNKSTLKQIYFDMKAEAMAKGEPFTISLDLMQKEAPSALHPFHGKPEHSVIFHNLDRQMNLYKTGGVRAIIVDYFTATKDLHTSYPNDAPVIPQFVIENTLKEARLWCETFHLKWE